MKTKTILLTTSTIAVIALTACSGSGNSEKYKPVNYCPTVGFEFHPFDAPEISETLKEHYLRVINEARSVARDCGEYGHFEAAPPLKWSKALYRAAYEHSYDMANTGYFSHKGSGTEFDWTFQVGEIEPTYYEDGSESRERVENNGYISGVEENIGLMNNRTPEHVVQRWLDSPGHCKAIMSYELQYMGMAKVKEPYDVKRDGWLGDYWTIDLGYQSDFDENGTYIGEGSDSCIPPTEE